MKGKYSFSDIAGCVAAISVALLIAAGLVSDYLKDNQIRQYDHIGGVLLLSLMATFAISSFMYVLDIFTDWFSNDNNEQEKDNNGENEIYHF